MIKPTSYLAIAASALCLLSSASALAQATSNITSTADPSRIEDQFEAPVFDPKITPKITVKEILPQNAPEGAENINLTLNSITFDGLVAYTKDEMRSMYADSLGETISLADIYTIANRMTARYRNDGYILTQVVVPPQTIDGGNVELRVVEGFIDTITVEAADESVNALDVIESYANNIRTGGALNIKELEHNLLLINELPGVSARSVIGPSNTQVGAADLRIIVSRDQFTATTSIDNFGSRYIGPLQLRGDVFARSYLGLAEQFVVQTVYAPEQGLSPELAYISFEYEQPIGKYGTHYEIFGSHAVTDAGFDLDVFDVEGRSQQFGVSVFHPFVRSRTFNLSSYASLDWRDVKSTSLILPTIRDDIRAFRFGSKVDFLETNFGVAFNSLELNFSQGLDILGATGDEDVNVTRQAGEATFFKANAEVQRLQRITSNVNVLAKVEGQWSANPLYSSEEFGVGGTDIGRAYDVAEIIGDDGLAGKLEVQWNDPYEINGVDKYQLYGFYDIGRVWDQDATTSATKKQSLASTGFGVRAQILENVEATAAVAFPLTRNVETQRDDDPRGYFSLKRKF